jgi:hypothetical protein
MQCENSDQNRLIKNLTNFTVATTYIFIYLQYVFILIFKNYQISNHSKYKNFIDRNSNEYKQK